MNDYLLYTDSLTKTYNNYDAVKCINLHVRKGAIYGLIGRNGAGKTTLLKMISGLSTPTSGQIHLFGKSGKELAAVREQVACLIEAPGLYPDMSAYQNLKCKSIQRNIKSDAYIEKLLELVGIESAGNKRAKHFSMGMKQRSGLRAGAGAG